MRKKSYLTVTDQFCGAGGSSQGVRNAAKKYKGVEVKLALNHWKLAIETHNSNFPDTLHDCTDISACDPRRYPTTDILITSPECTNHSLAKGQKVVKKQIDMFDKGVMDPSAERSRATMWDVPRFAEYHNYNIIIVENVVDARKWVMFESWLHAMHALGYNHKCCYLNSMHFHPTPQSRDRMYIVFWKKGNRAPKLDYMPLAFCSKCERNIQAIQTWKRPDVHFGKYDKQYVYCCPSCGTKTKPYYYASFNCIDWSDLGTRIGERAKPLSEKTITRIEYGLKKYGAQPMQVITYSPGYTKKITDPCATVTTNDHHGLCTPMIMHTAYSKEARGVVRSVNDPAFTQVSFNTQAIITPFIIKLEHSQRSDNVSPVNEAMSTQNTRQSSMLLSGYVKSTSESLPTQTTCQGMGFVSSPFITTSRGQSKAHSSTDALTTQSQMINHGIVTDESFKSFISYYYGKDQASNISDPLGTVSCNDRCAMINYQQPKIEDCYYRMLKPPEVKLAMAFDKDYIVLGSGRWQVKQLGNAVTPPAMEWLVSQCIESLN